MALKQIENGRLVRLIQILVLLLGGGVLLVACGNDDAANDETVAEVAFTTYEDAAVGITFKYPEEWVLRGSGGAIEIATSAELLDDDKANDGGLVNIGVSSTERFGTDDPKQILNFFTQAGLTNIEVVQEPTNSVINGQPAARAECTGINQAETPSFEVAAIVQAEFPDWAGLESRNSVSGVKLVKLESEAQSTDKGSWRTESRCYCQSDRAGCRSG